MSATANGCKCLRPGKSLHMSAALHMSETLQMWLQMSANPAANIRGPANVVNFTNIRDKKRLRVLAKVRRRFLGWRVSGMKKGGIFPALNSFVLYYAFI